MPVCKNWTFCSKSSYFISPVSSRLNYILRNFIITANHVKCAFLFENNNVNLSAKNKNLKCAMVHGKGKVKFNFALM